MAGSRGVGSDGVVDSLIVVGQELRRRNASAVVIDVLYVFTTAFLATLAVRGFWPAVIGGLPLATFLYFAWKSSKIFFLANLAVIALTVAATEADLLPF